MPETLLPMVTCDRCTRIVAVTLNSLPKTVAVPGTLTVPAVSYTVSAGLVQSTAKFALVTVPSGSTAGREPGSTAGVPTGVVAE